MIRILIKFAPVLITIFIVEIAGIKISKPALWIILYIQIAWAFLTALFWGDFTTKYKR